MIYRGESVTVGIWVCSVEKDSEGVSEPSQNG